MNTTAPKSTARNDLAQNESAEAKILAADERRRAAAVAYRLSDGTITCNPCFELQGRLGTQLTRGYVIRRLSDTLRCARCDRNLHTLATETLPECHRCGDHAPMHYCATCEQDLCGRCYVLPCVRDDL